jgi:drug/metabolite transporter (DMT)-like permease
MNAKTFFMLLSFSIFTGATFNLAKYAVEYFSAYSAAAWRFGVAAVIMFIILLVKEKVKSEFLKRNVWMYGLLGIIGIFGFNALFFLGMKYTSPVNGALIMATNPLLTTILSRFILDTPITKRQGLGAGFSLIGVILVITQGSWHMISMLSFSVGDIFILVGNLCWALYGVLGRRYLRDSSSLQTTTYTMVVGALCLVMVSAFHQSPLPIANIPIGAWGAIAFMVFFTTVLGYLFWNEGIRILGANKTSIFFNLVPVVTMIISSISGMAITWIQIIGTILVIAGVIIASGLSLHQYTKHVPANVQ